jgi:hypothetical protein
MEQRYQVMPPLSPEEYEALKADIAEHGVLVPVEYDDEGNILDGFHRVQICQELGLDWPKVVRNDLTDAQKLEHAWTLNLTRRHLSREQKQAIAIQLRQDGWTQERIAQSLCVSRATISMWLTEFVNSDELVAPPHITGKDGKRYPPRKVRKPSIPHLANADQGSERDRPASPLPQEPDPFEPAATVGEIVPAVPSTALPPTAITMDPQVPREPDTHHPSIGEDPPAQLSHVPASTAVRNGPIPRQETLGTPVDRCLRLMGELCAELHQMEDQQDLWTIGETWSPQMREACRQQCAYVIGRLQLVAQALANGMAADAPALQAEDSCHDEECPSDEGATPADPSGKQPEGVRARLAGAPVAFTERTQDTQPSDAHTAPRHPCPRAPRPVSRRRCLRMKRMTTRCRRHQTRLHSLAHKRRALLIAMGHRGDG